MYPFIILILGFGISYILERIPRKFKSISIYVFIAIYAISLGNFIIVYFYQLPMQGAGDFHMRTLSKYLVLARQENKPIIVYSTQGADIFKKYLVYSNSITRDTIQTLSLPIKPDAPITFNGITFTSCDNTVDVENPSAIHIISNLCGFADMKTPTHTKISRLSDGGTIFDIYNNPVCNRDILSTYPNGITLNDFAVESMSREEFCTTFISK